MKGRFPRLKKMLADGGYRGQKLIDEARKKLNAEFSVVLRPDESEANHGLSSSTNCLLDASMAALLLAVETLANDWKMRITDAKTAFLHPDGAKNRVCTEWTCRTGILL